MSHLPESVALTLPHEIAGWRRSIEAEKENVQAELVGKKSQSWVYERNDLRVVIAIDFPFEGFHDLRVCYVNAGWTVSQAIRDRNEDGTYVAAQLARMNEHGYFWYSLLNEQGTWVQPRPDDTIARLVARVRDLNPNDCSYQVQVWVQRYEPLTEDQRSATANLFLTARRELAAQVMQQIGGAR